MSIYSDEDLAQLLGGLPLELLRSVVRCVDGCLVGYRLWIEPSEPPPLVLVDGPLPTVLDPRRDAFPIAVPHVDHEEVEEPPFLESKEELEACREWKRGVTLSVLEVFDHQLHGFALRLEDGEWLRSLRSGGSAG